MVNSGRHKESEKYVMLSEDPWPYEYLINALQFFSMRFEQLKAYLVPDFDPVLFHGSQGDFISGNALEATVTIFTDILHVGLSFQDWIDDPKLENLGMEEDFKVLYQSLLHIDCVSLESLWPSICHQAQTLLSKLNWPMDELPEFTCERMLNEYSYCAYQESLH